MDINLKLHNIILFVGPSGSGKTHFYKNHLEPHLKSLKNDFDPIKYCYISSDEIRKELYSDYDKSKADDDMIYVSEQAFNLLKTKVDLFSQYPVNNEFIVVDTTGLNSTFRNEIYEIARKNNYNVSIVMFNYKNKSDYHNATEHEDRRDSGDKLANYDFYYQYKKFRKHAIVEVKGEVKKNEFDLFNVTSNNFDEIQFLCDDLEFYKSHFINPDDDYFVIGDVHGCYDELISLIEKKNETNKVILIGDIIDKNTDENIKKTIEYVYENMKQGNLRCIIGNHENFVYNYINNISKYKETDSNIIKKHFSTVYLLVNDEELKEKFIYIFENSRTFYQNNFHKITHAPVSNKYIGKIDRYSLKKQRNFVYTKKTEDMSHEEWVKKVENDLDVIKTQARQNQPLHVFGHVMTAFPKKFFGNKLFIDGGCVANNKLVGVRLYKNFNPRFEYVESVNYDKNNLVPKLFTKDIFEVNLSNYDHKDFSRINYLIKDKVNYISSTMSPSDKDIDNDSLESVKTGLDYYRNKGIGKVILQPKHMGSRCNVYLHKDFDKSYFTTRKGYIIKRFDDETKKALLTPLYEKFNAKYFESNNIELIILDSELMPWTLIGRGLVENEFVSNSVLGRNSIQTLIDTGFESLIDQKLNDSKFKEFISEINTESRKKLIEKYSHSVEGTFRNLYYSKDHFEDLELSLKNNEIFKQQLEIFGADTKPEIKPFSILKIVYVDGSEKLFFDQSNIDMYKEISDMSYCVIDFGNNTCEIFGTPIHESFNNDIENGANYFYDYITNTLQMEGVVIKPEIVYNKGIAPYLKVRNRKYLTLVYGYDYLQDFKYNKLITRKSIKNKLRVSINQFEIGKAMLEIPYNEINDENQHMKNMYLLMIGEEKKEETIDPRL